MHVHDVNNLSHLRLQEAVSDTCTHLAKFAETHAWICTHAQLGESRSTAAGHYEAPADNEGHRSKQVAVHASMPAWTPFNMTLTGVGVTRTYQCPTHSVVFQYCNFVMHVSCSCQQAVTYCTMERLGVSMC
jgi:hypothetical protein